MKVATELQTVIREAQSQLKVIPDHPGKALNKDLRESYVVFLAMVAQVDGAVTAEENAYLAQIAESLHLKGAAFGKALQAAQKPEAKHLVALVKMAPPPVQWGLVLDALLLALADGVMHQREKELVGSMMELFGFQETQAAWVTRLACGLTSADADLIQRCRSTLSSTQLAPSVLEAYVQARPLERRMLEGARVEAETTYCIEDDVVLTRDLVVQSKGHLVIRNARVTLSGDAAILVKGAVTILNSEIVGSDQAKAGYLVVAEGATAFVCQGSVIRGVERPGIMLDKVREITLIDTRFEDCVNKSSDRQSRTGVDGGGLKIVDHSRRYTLKGHALENVALRGCHFQRCHTPNGKGGALYVDVAGEVKPKGGSFTAIYGASSAPATVPFIPYRCHFDSCSTGQGSLIHAVIHGQSADQPPQRLGLDLKTCQFTNCSQND